MALLVICGHQSMSCGMSVMKSSGTDFWLQVKTPSFINGFWASDCATRFLNQGHFRIIALLLLQNSCHTAGNDRRWPSIVVYIIIPVNGDVCIHE
jgi:hypothetical protein